MVNDFVEDESKADITVTLTEQRPALTATTFTPDALHNFSARWLVPHQTRAF